MAKDYAEALQTLGIAKANVMGISQGGMIAQYIAIDYPDLVKNLILTVTLSKPNETSQKVIARWIDMAENSNYKALITDTAEKSYSQKYLKRYRFLYPILGYIGKSKDFQRFILQANSCLKHNAYDKLPSIKCPVLVIGGADDQIVCKHAALEISKQITNSKLFIYNELGHGAYEEVKGFSAKVISFLNENA